MTVTWDDGVRGLLDFGHNPDGLRALYGLARVLAGQLDDASIVAVLSQAGDRSDADLAALAAAVVEGGAVRVVLWESEGLRRGRPVGEVVARLRSALREKGLPETAISVAPGEAAAIEQARGLAARGDLVVVAPWTER